MHGVNRFINFASVFKCLERRLELKCCEIILEDRQDADRHSAKVIITPRENPCCPQGSYLIIAHFFRVIPSYEIWTPERQ